MNPGQIEVGFFLNMPDGVVLDFVLPFEPFDGSLKVYLNGQLCTEFSLSTDTVTLTAAPSSTDLLSFEAQRIV